MSGSKKGRKLRPYRSKCSTGVFSVTFLTPEQIEEDRFAALPTTAELLALVIPTDPA